MRYIVATRMEHGAREKEIMDVTKASDEYHAIKLLEKKRKFHLHFHARPSADRFSDFFLCCVVDASSGKKRLSDVTSNQM